MSARHTPPLLYFDIPERRYPRRCIACDKGAMEPRAACVLWQLQQYVVRSRGGHVPSPPFIIIQRLEKWMVGGVKKCSRQLGRTSLWGTLSVVVCLFSLLRAALPRAWLWTPAVVDLVDFANTTDTYHTCPRVPRPPPNRPCALGKACYRGVHNSNLRC